MPMPSIKVVISGIDELSSVLNKSTRRIRKMGESVRNIGRTMTIGATIPLAAMGAMTLKTAGDFEASMNRVQNLTQATGKELNSLRMQARQLGATTAFSASEAADAMGVLGLAGFETNEILQSVSSVLNTAAAGNIDMAEAAEVLTGVMAGFNKSASQTNDISDLLVKTMQSSKTDILGVGEAMSFVAPMAKSLGVTLEDTALAVGLLSNANIKGARAGTTFRAILASLAKPTAEAAKTLERLKIDKTEIFDADGQFKSLTGTIEAFRRSGATAQDMIAIFGRKMGIGMSAMVTQGTEKLNKLRETLSQAGGAAKEAADVQMKGLNGQLKALRSAFEELQLAIADTGLLDFVTKMVKKLSNFTRTIAAANPKFLKLGIAIAGIVAALGPLLMVIGTGMIIVAKFAAAIASAGGIIALISNPIGWAIAGIIAFIGIITYMVSHSQSKLTKLLTYFFPLAGIMTWVITRWKRILPFIKLFVFTIVGLMKLLYRLLKPILTPIANLFIWIGDLIFKALDTALSTLEKLTSLVLPEWLEKKIGLGGEITGPGTASELNDRAQSAVQVNQKSEAVIRFEGNTQGLTVESASPNLQIDTDRGELLPEGG